MICKTCQYCKAVGQAETTGNNRHGFPREKYYCTHPEIKHVPRKAFGNRAEAFIAFSTSSEPSVNIKTSPRWCLLKKADK